MIDLYEMMRLYNKCEVDITLVVMHGDHVVERRRFVDGFPDTPLKCSCGEEVKSDDLRYDFETENPTDWLEGFGAR